MTKQQLAAEVFRLSHRTGTFKLRSVAAAVLLHLLHNTFSLGVSRRWFLGLGPVVYGVPALLLLGAVLGGCGLGGLAWLARRRAAAPE